MLNRTEKHLLKLYNMLSILFASLFVIAVFRIITDFLDPSDLIVIRAIGYLMLSNQCSMMYKLMKISNELKEK